MVSISRAAPAASRIWSVAFMISGPMPSPCATVIGVLVGISGIPSIVGLLYTVQPDPVVFFYTRTPSPRRHLWKQPVAPAILSPVRSPAAKTAGATTTFSYRDLGPLSGTLIAPTGIPA